ICHRQQRQNQLSSSSKSKWICILLSLNSCLCILFNCSVLLYVALSRLLDDINNASGVGIGGQSCELIAYLFYVSVCLVYSSYSLQAFYRLCCVVLYKYKYLVQCSTFCLIILFRWCFCCLVFLPVVLLKQKIFHQNQKYYCIARTPSIFVYFVLTMYGIPLILTTIFYLWIMFYIKNKKCGRYRENHQRDLIIIKRIMITILSLFCAEIPRIALNAYYYATGYFLPITSSVSALLESIAFIFLSMMTLYFTMQIQTRIYIKNRINKILSCRFACCC
ncbi:unnamed protein product, partial [Didymodactylos carnosus]